MTPGIKQESLPRLPPGLSYHPTKSNPVRLYAWVPLPKKKDDGVNREVRYFPFGSFDSIEDTISAAVDWRNELGQQLWEEWPLIRPRKLSDETQHGEFILPEYVSVVNYTVVTKKEGPKEKTKVIAYIPVKNKRSRYKTKSFSVGKKYSLKEAVDAASDFVEENMPVEEGAL